jgi:uncharacterized protein YlxW (UPF0749 family)
LEEAGADAAQRESDLCAEVQRLQKACSEAQEALDQQHSQLESLRAAAGLRADAEGAGSVLTAASSEAASKERAEPQLTPAQVLVSKAKASNEAREDKLGRWVRACFDFIGG